MPSMPDLPEMPALELPAMPDLPEIPAMKLPAMPELPEIPELPNLPDMPTLPKLSLPEVNLPELGLPELSLPESPDIELPSMPSLPEIPESVRDTVSGSMDSVTRVCGDLGNKIAAWPVWKLIDFKVIDNSDNSSVSIETKDEAAIEVTEDDTTAKESQIEAEKAAAFGDKSHAEEIVPTAEIDNVEVIEENTNLEDGDVNIVEDLAMASEKIVVNVMEEISTKSDEHVVDNIVKASEEMFVNIMESIEKIETIEIPEKIEDDPSPNSEEPTLGDVENLDNMVAANLVEKLVEASQEIVVNIMDLNPEEKLIDDSPSTSEELSTALDDKESLDNGDVISGVESLAKASQDIVENIMELNTNAETNVDSENAIEDHSTNTDETTSNEVENLDSDIPSKGVESLVKASQDIVENIMELKTDGETNVDSDTDTENHLTNSEGTTPSEVEDGDSNIVLKGVESLVMASQDIVENIMELNTDNINVDSDNTVENVVTNTEETIKKDESIDAEDGHKMGG